MAFTVSVEGLAGLLTDYFERDPVSLGKEGFMHRYKDGQKVVFQNTVYDFGYYSETGKAVLFPPGESDLQGGCAVALDDVRPLTPTLVPECKAESKGQPFASIATIRAAIFDVIDAQEIFDLWEGDHGGNVVTEEDANVSRTAFVDRVIARLAELQSHPHDGIKLENLCDLHKQRILPIPTSSVCVMCQAERNRK